MLQPSYLQAVLADASRLQDALCKPILTANANRAAAIASREVADQCSHRVVEAAQALGPRFAFVSQQLIASRQLAADTAVTVARARKALRSAQDDVSAISNEKNEILADSDPDKSAVLLSREVEADGAEKQAFADETAASLADTAAGPSVAKGVLELFDLTSHLSVSQSAAPGPTSASGGDEMGGV